MRKQCCTNLNFEIFEDNLFNEKTIMKKLYSILKMFEDLCRWISKVWNWLERSAIIYKDLLGHIIFNTVLSLIEILIYFPNLNIQNRMKVERILRRFNYIFSNISRSYKIPLIAFSMSSHSGAIAQISALLWLSEGFGFESWRAALRIILMTISNDWNYSRILTAIHNYWSVGTLFFVHSTFLS